MILNRTYRYILLFTVATFLAAATPIIPIVPIVPIALAAEGPYMPAPPKQVLKEISAAPDVIAIVSGGWGYKKESATVIGNPYKGTKNYFKLRPFEEELMDVRNREEFYIMPSDGERYFPVGFKVLSYKAASPADKGAKKFDFATGEVVLLPEKYWKEMDSEIKTKKNNPVVAVFKDKVIKMKRDYWFEVSEPIAHNNSLKENK